MKTFDDLKEGDKLLCTFANDSLEVVIWRGEIYLAGEHDMWLASEFDPTDWEII